MKIADVLTRVRIDVNDLDSDRWEDSYIIDILNEAYCEIHNIRPDLFQEIIVLKLEEGEWQTPCCCSKIHSIDGISDRNGIKIDEIRAIDKKASIAFGKKRKCQSRPYPSEYGIENGKFWVNPPVKPNQDIYVRALCSVPPKSLPYNPAQELDKTGCEYYGAILDFICFRLLGTETESNTSIQKSQLHHKLFYEKLGIHQNIKKQYEKKSKE